MRATARRVGRVAVSAMLPAIAVAVLAPAAVLAHAPEGASNVGAVELGPIVMLDEHSAVDEVTIDEMAAVHGDLCICVMAAFRATQTAVAELYGEDELPVRGELTVLYNHPGKGHQQVLEALLSPECVTYEKLGDPQQLTSAQFTYRFSRTDIGESITLHVRGEIVPVRFTELRYAVDGFEKSWHAEEPSQAERDEYAVVWSGVMDSFASLPEWELYEEIEQPEEPAPAGAIAFSAAVLVFLGLGFVYSARSRGRN